MIVESGQLHAPAVLPSVKEQHLVISVISNFMENPFGVFSRGFVGEQASGRGDFKRRHAETWVHLKEVGDEGFCAAAAVSSGV